MEHISNLYNDSKKTDADTWLGTHVVNVRRECFATVDRFSVSEAQRHLLRAILTNAFAAPGLDLDRCAVATRLPLLIFAAIKGKVSDDALALSVTLTLLEAGIYTLDHIMDHELSVALVSFSPAAILLGAVDLTAHLPQRALIATGAVGDDLRDLLEMLCVGLARISAGQLCDIGLTPRSGCGKDDVSFAVSMKTGERRALYAQMAARLALADDDVLQAAGDFARSLGYARQVRSDLIDLVGAKTSRDLKSGKLTLPLALLIEQVDAAGFPEIENLLSRARWDESVNDAVRNRLRDSGALRRSVAIAMSHCRNSAMRLRDMKPHQPAGRLLENMVQDAAPGGFPVGPRLK